MVLLNSISRFEEPPVDLEHSCLALTDYGVAPRYPGWEDVAGDIDLDAVLDASKSVLAEVLARLDLTGSAR
jgi:hypothetical protein